MVKNMWKIEECAVIGLLPLGPSGMGWIMTS